MAVTEGRWCSNACHCSWERIFRMHLGIWVEMFSPEITLITLSHGVLITWWLHGGEWVAGPTWPLLGLYPNVGVAKIHILTCMRIQALMIGILIQYVHCNINYSTSVWKCRFAFRTLCIIHNKRHWICTLQFVLFIALHTFLCNNTNFLYI